MRVETVPPLPFRSATVSSSPFWIGSAADANLMVRHPVVRARHIGLVERADGWWLVRGEGDARVDSLPIGDGRRAENGATVELAPGCALRLWLDAPKPEVGTAPPRPSAPAAARKRTGLRPSLSLSVRTRVVLVVGTMTLGIAGYAFWRAARIDRPPATELTIEQSIELDSLLAQAYEHIERGSTLLEFGATQQALSEFAAGITVLQLHPLHRHPAVAPRIAALETAVSAIYRARRLAIPDRFARSTGGVTLARVGLAASVGVDEFTRAINDVSTSFGQRFGAPLVVTGRDHAEHLSLYGSGGAVDVRTRGLTPDRIQWLVDACRTRGLRVKDFSRDAILQAQIAAAMKAGLADRAGTGLHLHVDRFAGQRDRWTVP